MKNVRQAAQRKETKKKFFFLPKNIEQFVGFVFFISVLSLSIWVVLTVKNWVDNPERVVLSQLVLTGDSRFTNEDDIRKAILGLGLPNTYVAQDVDDIQQEIMRLPWVKQVSVRKKWPDRLIVNIVEYQPSYVWNDIFLLDENAIIFSVPKDRVNSDLLPKLFGPIGKEKLILEVYRQLEDISKKSNDQHLALSISDAIADEKNAWQLVVKQCIKGFCIENQTILLKLGREKIIERYIRFIRLFGDIQADLLTNERLAEIDLRYENGISVKKQEIEE
ncbi:FtsQ-type POTRA domain-containing protein [Orbus sturtevantii]|uniref:FtsQ-type POTRA domain-containing protein n=1 Tax=Orbus sturtevantii TaxID=3074109 RepID=UPI00370DCBB6